MLLRAILAAAFGTVAMTLSSTTEMQWVGRPASVAPGLAFAKLLSFVGAPEIKGRALDILATWVHWLYGAWWGVAFWVLIDVAGLPLAATAVAFFLVVWLSEQVELPLLGVAPPGWTWGAKAVLTDLWHHGVYVAGTVVGWVLIGAAV